METKVNDQSSSFDQAMWGEFQGVLQWETLDQLWERICQEDDSGWYLYTIGELVPEVTALVEDVKQFIEVLDVQLHSNHQEKYCGIVYVDNLDKPTFIKVYDPTNLGTSCSRSTERRLPKWIISKLKPYDLHESTQDEPKNKFRWWKKLVLTRTTA